MLIFTFTCGGTEADGCEIDSEQWAEKYKTTLNCSSQAAEFKAPFQTPESCLPKQHFKPLKYGRTCDAKAVLNATT